MHSPKTTEGLRGGPLAGGRLAAPGGGGPELEGTARIFSPPGGILVWLVVLLELATFGAGLVVFLRSEMAEPGVFREGRAGLGRGFALVNTLLLLSGGWVMAEAVERVRSGRVCEARRGIWKAAAFGVAFLGVKGWEYTRKLDLGLGLHRDAFHTLYWLITGFHYLHVAFAVGLLLAMGWGLRRGECRGEQVANIESSGVFWHLCDLIWLFLVPVIYLLP